MNCIFDEFVYFHLRIFNVVAKDTPDSDNDTTCAELKADEGYKSSVNNGGGGTISRSCSRPMSICSEPEKRWMDVVAGK